MINAVARADEVIERAARCMCLLWVNRVTLAVGRPLPVYPDERTSSDRPGMSGWCQ